MPSAESNFSEMDRVESFEIKSVICVQKTSLHERCIKAVTEFTRTHSVFVFYLCQSVFVFVSVVLIKNDDDDVDGSMYVYVHSVSCMCVSDCCDMFVCMISWMIRYVRHVK